MPFSWLGPVLSIGSALLGSSSASDAASQQSGAATDSARMQTDAANRAADMQNAQFQQTRADQQPWLQAGQGALNKLIPMASNYTPFGMSQFNQDPGYAFRMNQGQIAMDRSAAASGGLQSGAALKAASDYGQASGSQEYQNAFNRYQTERNAALNPLQSLAGVGQSTASSLGALGANNASAIGGYYTGAANNAGNYMTQGANARAAGQIGSSNALSGGLSTYMNNQQSNSLVNALRGLGNNSGYGSFTNYPTNDIPMQPGGGY